MRLREMRMREFNNLQLYRDRYDRLVAEGKHAEAAIVRGQISRCAGRLDGMDMLLEAMK